MAEDWRVCLTFDRHSSARKYSFTAQCYDHLHRGLGAGIRVSVATPLLIFVWADSEDAAGKAERLAQEVLAEHNLSAEVRIEHFDSSRLAWRDMRAGRLEAAGPENNPRRKRRRSVAALLSAVVDSALENIDGFFS